MVVCIVALVALGFMSIFSAKYRSWFREALSCVSRRFVLKPCDTGFDQKVKSVVTAKLLKRHAGLAGLVRRHFEAISWVFMIALVASIAFTANGLYNFAVYGSCDPHSDFCIFNPAANVSCGSQDCADRGCDCGAVGCDEENNFSACEGDCECNEDVCG